MEQVFEFVYQAGAWYYHDRKPARRKGAAGPIHPVYKEGLHTLLQAVGRGAAKVWIHTSDEPVDGSDELELTEPDADGQGGYYLLKTLHQKPYVLLIRFFHVYASFGYLPSRLYLRFEAVP
jgi:hypothetical protein